MKLVIGGTAQGKLEYAIIKYNAQDYKVWDGVLPKDTDDRKRMREPVIINHLHRWVRNRMKEGGCPEEEILSFPDRYKDCIIICDEIGNGIVPAEPFEREYRERVGRILVRLAKRAEEVERVICGIGQKIK